MKLHQLILSAMAAVSLIMTTQLYADQHQEGKRRCPCMMKVIMKNLDLTPQQRQQMKLMKEAMRSNMMSNRDQMKAIGQQKMALIMSDNMNESALNDLISKKTALIAKKMKMRMMMANKMYQLLTPEQKNKYKMEMEKMMKSGSMCACKKR